ncbi:MAG: nucleotidyltransferase family protein [Deltaproteobacteria bacterium]|nr:MAG: nucleotidyltransferase family protein [Deltaproteobacteria bacterium]
MSPRIGAVVLAAGASLRMGRSKAAICWGARSFARHVVDLALGRGCDPVVFVWGAHRPPTDVEGLEGVTTLEHPGWPEGPFSTLRAGLAALADDAAALVLTVDRPHLRPSTLAALLDVHRRTPDAVVQPAYGGRHGHPVLLPSWACRALREACEARTLREFLRAPNVAPARRFVEVDDPAVVENLDTPADLSKLPKPC